MANHRTGVVRGSRSGRRRGTMPAAQDPIIMGRRALAAPLWIQGHDARAIREQVNAWLIERDELPVSLQTIYKDHAGIIRQWRESYEGQLDDALTARVAGLHKLLSMTHRQFERAEAMGRNCAPFIDQARKIEMDLASLQGLTSHRVEVTDRSFQDAISRLLTIEPLGPIEVVPLLSDEGFGELLPARGDG